MATETVLDEVKKFWSSEARYREHKLLYKRGLLLWGPPGSGKTIAVKLLMNNLVKQDGIVILAQSIPLLILCLKAVRRIEPTRNLIVVLEDIDEIINFNGESSVLSLLDGENNVDNILHLATTNYPERLGARIINRPSRFDRRVFVGMPSPEARRAYLEKATNGGLTPEQLDTWVADTNKMSIAHLRELVAASFCLDQPYEEVIQRLIDMATQVKPVDEFTKARMGFKSPIARGSDYELTTGSSGG
jgi:SpoVK/Ycf46/Vps4 family AAA+-type ATPase